MRGALKMQPHPSRIDEFGRLLIAGEFQRKLGISLDKSPKVTLTKVGDTLVIQKAKEDCELPNTKELDILNRVVLDKELMDSMGWDFGVRIGVNDDIIAIKPLTPEQIQLVKQREQQRKDKQKMIIEQREEFVFEQQVELDRLKKEKQQLEEEIQQLQEKKREYNQ
ncbi:MAG: hypothetical protein FWD97_09850, partial [Defluviitaleaceae bacterium]|nr:hypothetical protein [Defluviitaleaceae bacterium]